LTIAPLFRSMRVVAGIPPPTSTEPSIFIPTVVSVWTSPPLMTTTFEEETATVASPHLLGTSGLFLESSPP
jgi:hypothetical protein